MGAWERRIEGDGARKYRLLTAVLIHGKQILVY